MTKWIGALALGAWFVQPPLISVQEALQWPNPPPLARLQYGDGPLQFGDLRLPAGDGPHPVVVVIHGGCWRADFAIDYIGSFAEALTDAGVATWTIGYRRVGDPGGGWPGTFQDVGAGVDHLRSVARQYPLDLDRVVVAGHSAGGHLALWLAARSTLADAALRGDNPLALSGVVSLAGVDDLRRAVDEGVCGDMAAQLVGGTPDAVPERYALASPIELLPRGVPQRLVNGSRDPIVPEAFGRAYAEAARRAGAPVEITVLPAAGHFEIVAPTADEWPTVRDVVLDLLR